MRITNNFNLPDPIYRAIKNDDYSNGGADFSVTTLIDPPLPVHLKKKYWSKIEEDASEMIYALMGKSMHKVFEMAGKSKDVEEIIEPRFFTCLQNLEISGQIDRMFKTGDTWCIQDYKWMSIWEFVYGVKKEKEAQLNIYAYLAKKNGYEVDKLQIIMMFRDWSKMKSKIDSSHPSRQVIIMPVNLWTTEEQEKYILERLNIHKSPFVECTDEEKWAKPTKYAVMKQGRKSAVRLLDSEQGAEDYIDNHVDPKDVSKCYVQVRKSEPVRCENYCSVKDFCPYYKISNCRLLEDLEKIIMDIHKLDLKKEETESLKNKCKEKQKELEAQIGP